MFLRILAASTAWRFLQPEPKPPRTTDALYPCPPITMMDGDKRSGYAAEIMVEASHRSGLAVDEIELPVNRALSFVIIGPNNFIAGTKTPDAGMKFAITWPFCFETITHALIVSADKPYQPVTQ